MKVVCAVLLAVLSSAVSTAVAWGPASHFYFTCTASGVPVIDCASPAFADLLSGTEMPDAFGFGVLLQPLGHVALPGQGWKLLPLHSPLFAGYLYKLAPQYDTATFNATLFAQGFGMHVSADAAGFFEKGYLGYGWGHSGPQNGLVNDTANWLSLWPFMTAVDAHVYHTYFTPANVSLPTFGIPSDSPETSAFVSAAIQAANNDGVGLPQPSAANVSRVAQMWAALLGEEDEKARTMPQAAFGYEMVYSDRHGATTFDEAVSHFDLVAGCAIGAARTWLAAIMQAGSTPQSAVDATISYVKTAYAAGKCSPSG